MVTTFSMRSLYPWQPPRTSGRSLVPGAVLRLDRTRRLQHVRVEFALEAGEEREFAARVVAEGEPVFPAEPDRDFRGLRAGWGHACPSELQPLLLVRDTKRVARLTGHRQAVLEHERL